MELKEIEFNYQVSDGFHYFINKNIIFFHKSIEDAYVEISFLVENKLEKIENWQKKDLSEMIYFADITIDDNDISIDNFLSKNKNGLLQIDFDLKYRDKEKDKKLFVIK